MFESLESLRRLSLDDLEAELEPPEHLAKAKISSEIGLTARRFLAHSPFACVASASSQGADCSPRGDGPGFAKVLTEKALALPDRAGNNLADTFRNVAQRPQLGLLFFVPGLSETLRVNGQGIVTDDPGVLARFEPTARPVRLALVVGVEEVFFHCGKSIIRSGLWETHEMLTAAATLGRDVFALENAERPKADVNAAIVRELLREGYTNEL
ncbi:pyridoxamine 5'-phosphate oxidase family protein [Kribbella sancticallisti]|uniref:Pyridoxamine 5'-phosphate oxidase family protein n=1 Tax=Kribbella sancticallisti TaxID=460087 RepID=A0ABP4QX89_9ACTN